MIAVPSKSQIMTALRKWRGDRLLARVFKNAGLLLGGRVTTGVLNLGILAISAHALGAEQFGLVILVQTYAATVTGVATFQSWQAVIRYGALALEKQDIKALHALLRFCTLLDIGGVVIGTIVAWVAVPWVGPLLNWDADVMAAARPYCLVILFTVTATPTGLLRLLGRFDLLSIQSVVSPFVRLIGVAIAAWFHASLAAYIAVWFVGGAVAGIVLVAMGWIEAARRGQLKDFALAPGMWLGAAEHHPGLWRFAVVSNLHATVQIVSAQLTTVLVGGLAGPASAGLFKVARDVATAITKPAELLNNAIYPELARLASQNTWRPMPRLMVRGGVVASGAGVVLMMLAAVGGPWFLKASFGPEFVAAQSAMMLLLAAATVSIAGFPMDPALYAMGRPEIPLQVNTIAVLLYVPALVVLTRVAGPVGAGIAALLSSVVIFAAMALFTGIHLRRRIGASSPGPLDTGGPAAGAAKEIP
ncbi:MAG: lipopolysaccharide biosynthesis protein [Rhodospirillaceae bacterium]|nr:MAG: lipopolysaccharide biosynthesis protein [Rhodospirillaceae bacterium]